MIRPFSKSFSSISVKSEIKAAARERGWSTRAEIQRQKTQNGWFTEEHTSEFVWWANMQNTLWPRVPHRQRVQGVSIRKKKHCIAARQALWHVRDKGLPGGRITGDLDQSKREGEKRDIAGEAWRSAHFCGASGERSFIPPCSSDGGDH